MQIYCQNSIAFMVILVLCVQQIESWSGNVCSRSVCYSVSKRVCAYRTWIACCRYKTVWRARFQKEYFCCSGWRHDGDQNCVIPICEGNCYGHGRCIAPNKCICNFGYTGRFCMGQTCSHLTPCYPGTCKPGTTECSCSDGFEGSSCLKIASAKESPNITKASVWLSYIDREKNMEMYNFMADSTDPSTNKADEIWSQELLYNYLKVESGSFYTEPENLPYFPPYVNNSRFGIVKAEINLILSKIPRTGVRRKILLNKTHVCSTSKDNPENSNNCVYTDRNFASLIESGDILLVKLTISNGGMSSLVNPDQNWNLYKTNYYSGITMQKVMEFHFDATKPTHTCILKQHHCFGSRAPLNVVGSDITKSEINLTWSGWTDKLAGMFRYVWEVFKLEPDHTGALVEQHPLNPIRIEEVMHSTNIQFPTYTPPAPGMYSFILEAADRANNSRYARRFVLYDQLSKITLNPYYRLYVASAENETGNEWQKTLQSRNLSGSPLIVIWKNHFCNKIHVDGKLLNKILPYPPQLYKQRKNVITELDDNKGERTRAAINNVNGIVKYEYHFGRDKDGGKTIPDPASRDWKKVDDLLSERLLINEPRGNGDTIKIWVRAHDVMGNMKVDSTVVHFDSTAPKLENIQVNKNISYGAYPFSTRITLDAFDLNSGIFKVKYRLVSSDLRRVFKEASINGNKTTRCSDRRLCYSLPDGKYFNYQHYFDINHCWLKVPKKDLSTEMVYLFITAFNYPMLGKEKQKDILNLQMLDGLENYYGPRRLRLMKIFSNGVSLEWEHSDSCFKRTDLVLDFYIGTNRDKTMHLFKDAVQYSMIGLQQDTNYTASLRAHFGDQVSDAVNITFITAKEPAVSAGGIAGIVLFLILIAAVAAVGIFIWRRGSGWVHNTINRVRSSRRWKTPSQSIVLPSAQKLKNLEAQPISISNPTCMQDEDICLYGAMEFEKGQQWMIPRSNIMFMDCIKSGRFADIYLGSFRTNKEASRTVVIKALKKEYTEDDVFLMKAKINFAAKEVGEHPGIVNFIGAVLDDDNTGPLMLLDYCENGTLKDWLQKNRVNVTDTVLSNLYQFALEIAQGMEYLALQQITHRKLAARNILLTSRLNTKIYGFGPAPQEKDDEESGKERLPIKWIAIECLNMLSLKDATEKSDVWSYGIVLWEIFSMGDTPYPKIPTKDVKRKILRGYRMSPPIYSKEIYSDLMQRTWNNVPDNRPAFDEIVKILYENYEDTYITCTR